MSALDRASLALGAVTARFRGGDPREARNTLWLMAERVVGGVLSVTVMIAVARHLGPAQFGVLSYALSLVLLLGTFWTLGLSGVVVREIVKSPAREPAIVGTLLVLRTLGGGVAIVALLVITGLLGDTPSTRLIATTIMAGVVLLYALDGIDFSLQARLRSSAAVVARVCGGLISAALLVALVLTDAPFVWFAWAIAVEYAVGAAGLILAYRATGGRFTAWRVERAAARDLLFVSWPLILSGVANAINLRVDQVMLAAMQGSESVGTYAAAARLSEFWYFVPVAIAASAFPNLVRLRESDPARYAARLQQLYDTMILLALPVALVGSIASPFIISTLYGQDYAEAAPILAVHVWAGPFVFMSAVLSRWLIAEDRLIYSFYRHTAGAVVNVMINLVTIPRLGGFGAAIATLISYTVASYLAVFLLPATRSQALFMTRALGLPVRAVRRLVRSPEPPR